MSAPWWNDGPTGPISLAVPDGDPFWEDQPRDELGRWAPKEKRLEYGHLVQERPKRRRRKKPKTPADLAEYGEFGPGYRGPHVTVYEWPAQPGVTPRIGKPSQWADEPGVSVDVVASCCPECVYGVAEPLPQRQVTRVLPQERLDVGDYERRYRK
jgi:hypothetical protein